MFQSRLTKDAQLPRSPYLPSRRLPSSSSSSSPAPPIDDVLAPGDVVGDGFFLQGEQISTVATAPAQPHEPAHELEVVKLLGSGSYAVVYLVQEVLSRPQPSDDGHMSTIGAMDFDQPKHVVYGRKYAVKCLSKADLDEEALAVQMSEVTIHQSLHLHNNIVSLHRTLETSSFLLLLLEYVPGEDLFYFLEQARDHYDLDHTDSSVSTSHTPPTPSLLSNLHPSQLLSRTRLRLVASMFSQMCDAVAACHAQGVFHRDIKPENFIVTDGYWTSPDGRSERKVIVKLTDFGLSTTDVESADMDCGSAPYMSYECRNNVAPTYRPRAADVWSLGIVLINMLYHFNPWTDTAEGACSSFDIYRKDPFNFFMQRFMGMTRPVADVLANKVFCILENPHDDSERMSAAEFGAWARNLPNLLGAHAVHRTVSAGSTQGHRISLSMPLSHRPQSRHPSGSTTAVRTPAMPPRTLSRAPSFEPGFERAELSTVIDQDNEDDAEDNEGDVEIEGMTSRSTSTNKRRKRGARKGKAAAAAAALPATSVYDKTLAVLADASQSLAREISMASKSSSHRSGSASHQRTPFEPVPMYPIPTALLARQPPAAAPGPACAPLPAPVTKKPSKWKLSFGKNSASALAASAAAAAAGPVSPVEEATPSFDRAMASTASNVANLLMGLNAPAPPGSSAPIAIVHTHPYTSASSSSSSFSLPRSDADAASTWSRGRRGVRDPSPLGANVHGGNAPGRKPTSRSPGYALSAANNPHSRSLHNLHHPLPAHPMPGVPAPEPWAQGASPRGVSPTSARRPGGSSASSVVSANWRSSMSTASTTSSAGTSTSAFTRYSNSSARSVSTTATSVSSASWRTSVKSGAPGSTFSGATGYAQGHIPKNIKIMDGVPWELDQLPRGQHPNPIGDIFGSPPVRKARTRKPATKDKLDTITERPAAVQMQTHSTYAYGMMPPTPANALAQPVLVPRVAHPVGGQQQQQQQQKQAHQQQQQQAHQQQGQHPTLGPKAHASTNPNAYPYQRAPLKTPVQAHLRRDASTSTTDLGEGEGGKKVQKAQINTLAKLLSAMTGNGRK